MAAEGNQLMAAGVLLAFGLNPEQIAKAKTSWQPLLAAGKIDDEKRAVARRARQGKAAQESKAWRTLPGALLKRIHENHDEFLFAPLLFGGLGGGGGFPGLRPVC